MIEEMYVPKIPVYFARISHNYGNRSIENVIMSEWEIQRNWFSPTINSPVNCSPAQLMMFQDR